jgi:hypothetical protein
LADDPLSTPEQPRADERDEQALSRAEPPAEPGGDGPTDAAQPDRPADADTPAEPSPDAEPAALVTGMADPFATSGSAPGTDPYEGAAPPGYDWPTHGGYLGCLLGLMASCLVVGFVAWSPVATIPVPPLVRGLIAIAISVAAIVGLGRMGWTLGKRFYREYPQPTRHHRLPLPSATSPEEPEETLESHRRLL